MRTPPTLQIRVLVPFMTLQFPQTIPLRLCLSHSQACVRDGVSLAADQLREHFEDGGGIVIQCMQ